jgi:hypothetical protein
MTADRISILKNEWSSRGRLQRPKMSFLRDTASRIVLYSPSTQRSARAAIDALHLDELCPAALVSGESPALKEMNVSGCCWSRIREIHRAPFTEFSVHRANSCARIVVQMPTINAMPSRSIGYPRTTMRLVR